MPHQEPQLRHKQHDNSFSNQERKINLGYLSTNCCRCCSSVVSSAFVSSAFDDEVGELKGMCPGDVRGSYSSAEECVEGGASFGVCISWHWAPVFFGALFSCACLWRANILGC